MLAAFALVSGWTRRASRPAKAMGAAAIKTDRASYSEGDADAGALPTIPAPPHAGRRFSCRVSSVTDGDTFRCTDGDRVRLPAVATGGTDETGAVGQPHSTQRYLRSLAPGALAHVFRIAEPA